MVRICAMAPQRDALALVREQFRQCRAPAARANNADFVSHVSLTEKSAGEIVINSKNRFGISPKWARTGAPPPTLRRQFLPLLPFPPNVPAKPPVRLPPIRSAAHLGYCGR